MAFVQVVKMKGMASEQYDEVMSKAYGGHDLEDGELFHVAGGSGDEWWVIDGWETREQCDASGAKLMPALQELGLMENMMGPPSEFEIHRLERR
jgi:hypothetical protein